MGLDALCANLLILCHQVRKFTLLFVLKMGFDTKLKRKAAIKREEYEDEESPEEVSLERRNILHLLEVFHREFEKNPGTHPSEISKIFRQEGRWLNRGKYFIGVVPGVQLGDEFQYRVELCMVGLHMQMQAGISYVSGEHNKWGIPVASSIVLSNSGGYQDEDKGDTFVYHGSGGGKTQNQELTGGNLSLVNSYKLQIPIRVIRGMSNGRRKKVYRYDGLYRVTGYWQEDGSSGHKVYKYYFHQCNAEAPVFNRQQWETILKHEVNCS